MTALIKQERLEARVSAVQKNLFKRAAEAEGKRLSEFIVATLEEASQRIIKEQEVMVLSERDRKAFIKALMNPPPPNKALLAAVKIHKRLIESR